MNKYQKNREEKEGIKKWKRGVYKKLIDCKSQKVEWPI
jgi:hypothetical protein